MAMESVLPLPAAAVCSSRISKAFMGQVRDLDPADSMEAGNNSAGTVNM